MRKPSIIWGFFCIRIPIMTEKLGTWSEADEAERAMLTLNGSFKKGSVEEALGWLRQARANGNWAAHEALTQVSPEKMKEVAEESFRPQKPTKKAGLFTRFFGEKNAGKTDGEGRRKEGSVSFC